MIRVDGDIRRLTLPALDTAQLQELVYSTMSDQHRRDFEANLEVDYSYSVQGLARFRVNCFHHDRGVGGAFRTIPDSVWTLEDVGAPPIFRDIIDVRRGLVLLTGPTGSGKSTTLAALIDHLNNKVEGHVLTIEDPIEFVHKSKKCVINQREVHRDTHGFNQALRAALREDPDIILVGEMRDLETISLAMEASMTGHLVFGTLHTLNAMKTVDRVIEIFPANQQAQVRSTLADALRAVVSQTLMKRTDQKGRVAALEILICNPAVRNLIREGKTYQIPSVMQTGKKYGMQILDDALEEFVKKRMISPDDAYTHCIEKPRFLKYLKKAPTDFTEV